MNRDKELKLELMDCLAETFPDLQQFNNIYNEIIKEERKEFIEEIEKIIDKSKCSCELCAFSIGHGLNKEDKLIKSFELKQELNKLKKGKINE
jgi:hypothetical protein